MFFAALRSALSAWPQPRHKNFAWFRRLSTLPQALHCWLVYAGGTATSVTPAEVALYASMLRAMAQTFLRMVRFSPAFWRTRLPGAPVFLARRPFRRPSGSCS